jgi:pimeloyl-ACP methyl ester carboxylesterase/membrane protein DedA with SNARE-associated domain
VSGRKRRVLPVLLVAYLVLLAASHIARRMAPVVPLPADGLRTLSLAEVRHDSVGGAAVRIAFFDSVPAGSVSPATVVLLHGSPGSHGEVEDIAEGLAGAYRVIAPDLPGFGRSTRRIPDYSIRAHALYVRQLLDSLGVRRAHLVGFSMGGGVAVALADLEPDRVASITMLSAIGVQEYELLGDYHLNHALHGIQLAGLWALRELVPHFGRWDGGFFGVEYARNFYDTDQRPLRAAMLRYQRPMLIIQGRHDPLVPAGIADEHARIVPQSDVLMLEGDHFMAFMQPETITRAVLDFTTRVESGQAVTRSNAEPARIAAALEPFSPARLPRAQGIGFVVLLLLLAAATLVSEDLTCIATGLLVSRGTIGFLPGTLACLIGIVVGDFLLYFSGRVIGRRALKRRPFRWFVHERDIARTSAWFESRGPALVLATRFVPGTRLPTYLAAGILHTRFLPFAGFFLLAAVLWTPLLVGLAYLYGDAVLEGFDSWRRWSFPLVLAAGIAFLLVFELLVPMFSFRGRRLLLSRWRRLTRWEFWPPWVFYLPLVPYLLWLGLKHRSLTVFTAANPGIPGGGLAGESKWEILRGLRQAAPDRVPPTELHPASQPLAARIRALQAFRLAHGLSWPLVLKPDVGERGAGVAIVGSEAEAESYLTSAGSDVLAQQFVPGLEYGIFYYRMPGEAHGRIFSITDKRFPAVTGDGRSTLERLILSDDRAVCMARFLLDKHAARLYEVPTVDELVPLVELGTHCRGAAFFDGSALGTEALEAEVDLISRRFPGFWFGRYDVRASSVAELQAGRFTVIELNGATSEATSIYDPGNGLLTAYRTLARQWRILFEIGSRNRRAGVKPTGIGELAALLRRHREARRAHVA